MGHDAFVVKIDKFSDYRKVEKALEKYRGKGFGQIQIVAKSINYYKFNKGDFIVGIYCDTHRLSDIEDALKMMPSLKNSKVYKFPITKEMVVGKNKNFILYDEHGKVVKK